MKNDLFWDGGHLQPCVFLGIHEQTLSESELSIAQKHIEQCARCAVRSRFLCEAMDWYDNHSVWQRVCWWWKFNIVYPANSRMRSRWRDNYFKKQQRCRHIKTYIQYAGNECGLAQVICNKCQKHLGWHCVDAPSGLCEGDENTGICPFCSKPIDLWQRFAYIQREKGVTSASIR